MDESLGSWSSILQLKRRVTEINYELERTKRFMQNPFSNKNLSSDRRKVLWEKAAKKKSLLEDELSATNKRIRDLINQNQMAEMLKANSKKAKKPKGKKK